MEVSTDPSHCSPVGRLPQHLRATMVTMRFGIVEGEPGIFPDPVARVLRGLGRLLRRDEAAKPADDYGRKRPPTDAAPVEEQ